MSLNFPVSFNVFGMPGKLDLAPADVTSIWDPELSSRVQPITIFGGAGSAWSQLRLEPCTLATLWKLPVPAGNRPQGHADQPSSREQTS